MATSEQKSKTNIVFNTMIIDKIETYKPDKDKINDNVNLTLLYKAADDICKCLKIGLDFELSKCVITYDCNDIDNKEIYKILSDILKNAKGKEEEEEVNKFINYFNKRFPDVEYLYNRGKKYLY